MPDKVGNVHIDEVIVKPHVGGLMKSSERHAAWKSPATQSILRY